jgi:serine protease Do
VTVGAAPSEQTASADTPSANNSGKLGLVVRPVTSDEQEQLHSKSGLVVEQVGGAAAKAGVQPGDVILALNNERIESVAQLRRLIEKSGKHVALLVQRNDAKIYVPVDLG